jgi:hypothetical protein
VFPSRDSLVHVFSSTYNKPASCLGNRLHTALSLVYLVHVESLSQVKKLIMIIALSAAASTLHAAIGETPAQFELSQPTLVKDLGGGELLLTWRSKQLMHAGIFMKDTQGWFAVYESFYFNDYRPFTDRELTQFMVVAYPNIRWSAPITSNGQQVSDGFNKNGERFVTAEYGAIRDVANSLRIWVAPYYDHLANSGPAPAQQKVDSQTSQKRDCMIVATEVYARLRSSAVWSAIVAGTWDAGGSHAMALWKVAPSGHIFLYVSDENGTLELQTSSEKIEDIANAFNAQVGDKLHMHNWRFVQTPALVKE